MAYTVEDGTGLANSNSYVAVADADSYFADRGDTVWAAALSADKQAALVRATQAIDNYGYAIFVGYKSSSTQALEWPRTDAYDKNDYEWTLIPKPVKVACYEGGLIELSTPGALTPELARGGRIKSERVEGAITVEYDSAASATTVYTKFTRALNPVIQGSGNLVVMRV